MSPFQPPSPLGGDDDGTTIYTPAIFIPTVFGPFPTGGNDPNYLPAEPSAENDTRSAASTPRPRSATPATSTSFSPRPETSPPPCRTP